MQAIIIAGGQGTRLRPLTYDLPKPIIPIFNRPLLYYQIELLKRHGITDIILNLHYLADVLETTLGDGSAWGVQLRYVYESQPMGTAGAVALARPLLGREPVLVLNGDVLTDLDLTRFLAFHRDLRAKVSIGLTRVSDPTAYGLVFVDPHGRVSRFLEKPSYDEAVVDTVSAGLYWLEPEVLDRIPAGEPYSFERGLFPSLLADGQVLGGYFGRSYWLDIGTPRKYYQAHHDILSGRLALSIPDIRPNADQIWIGPGTEIDPSASLLGPVYLGRGVRIGRHARINPYTIIGDGVTIGDGAWIGESLIWPHSVIGPACRLQGAIVGKHCQLERDCQIGHGMVLGGETRLGKGSILIPGR
ncbi:MAG: NDP-sugar synthase [Candidatus Sericytochromatia bacterium]|nr:NDP-sugar synthase [Candidatus Sericytochromatia bacterium]